MCSITVFDDTGATTGVPSDFASSKLTNTSQLTPTTGVAIGAPDGSTMTFTVIASIIYHEAATVQGILADGTPFLQIPYRFTTGMYLARNQIL